MTTLGAAYFRVVLNIMGFSAFLHFFPQDSVLLAGTLWSLGALTAYWITVGRTPPDLFPPSDRRQDH